MSKLFETTITKKDTCLSYALQRTGTETSIEFVTDLEKEFDLIPAKETKIEIGDIVAWEKKVKTVSCATIIKEPSEDGISEMITENVNIRFHLGVVENKCMVSDLTRSGNAYYVPTIRKRYLSLIIEDSQKQCPFPDFVIRKKKPNGTAT